LKFVARQPCLICGRDERHEIAAPQTVEESKMDDS
jgi:hypothetical protein